MLSKGEQKLILAMWGKTKPMILKFQKQNPGEKIVGMFENRMLYGPRVPRFTALQLKDKFQIYPGKGNKKIYPALKNLTDCRLIVSIEILEWKDAKRLYRSPRSTKKKLKEAYTKKENRVEYCLSPDGFDLGKCLHKAERRKA